MVVKIVVNKTSHNQVTNLLKTLFVKLVLTKGVKDRLKIILQSVVKSIVYYVVINMTYLLTLKCRLRDHVLY